MNPFLKHDISLPETVAAEAVEASTSDNSPYRKLAVTRAGGLTDAKGIYRSLLTVMPWSRYSAPLNTCVGIGITENCVKLIARILPQNNSEARPTRIVSHGEAQLPTI